MSKKYEQSLTKQLKIFTDACDSLAELARSNDLHPEHVAYAQQLTRKRVTKLKTELEFKPEITEIELPSIGDEKEESKSSSKPDSKPAGESSAGSQSSPLGGGFGDQKKD